jgi:hypothetical protein
MGGAAIGYTSCRPLSTLLRHFLLATRLAGTITGLPGRVQKATTVGGLIPFVRLSLELPAPLSCAAWAAVPVVAVTARADDDKRLAAPAAIDTLAIFRGSLLPPVFHAPYFIPTSTALRAG